MLIVSPLPTPKKHRMISGGADLHRCRATPFEVLEHPLVAQTAAEKKPPLLGKPWWVAMRISRDGPWESFAIPGYHLLNIPKNYGKSQFSMGKSTINGNFQ